ncbi:MAG TPA: methyltransferase domain-containing protein [Propionibacterium sp.]|jgi:SAM-dependent methyltransferase|nr:methyltransferase domain-containing protein [Propionibacterium sp.]
MNEFQQVGSGNRRSTGRRRRSTAQQWLNELLVTQLDLRGSGLNVVDLGGGTGGIAAALAEAGHTVLVIDPSPDALAATQRRAAERELSDRMTAVQGDTGTLAEIVPPGSVDVFTFHRVLDRREGTAEALAAMATTLKPGGLLSIVINQRLPWVWQQAEAGNFDVAREILQDGGLLDRPVLLDLLAAGGWEVLAEHGVGVIADQVPEAAAEGHSDELLELEAAAAGNSAYLESATRLHVLATHSGAAAD